MKTCANCGLRKPVNYYYRYAANNDGLTSYCKTCIAERTKAYRKTPRGKKTKAECNRRYGQSEAGREARRRYRQKIKAMMKGEDDGQL